MGSVGGNKRLEEALRERGRAATAAVTDAKRTRWLHSSGTEDAGTNVTWRLQVQVKPDGEAPFEVTLNEAVPLGDQVSVGQAVAVLYDPDDHTRVAIDHRPPAMISILAGGPSPGSVAGIQVGASPFGRSSADAATNTSSLVARWRPNRLGDAAAGSGRTAHPALGGRRLSSVPTSPTTEAESSDNPEDRIAKLADLRDRGALTAAEFEKQKQRILGQ